MGLAEKRAAKEFQDKQFVEFRKAIAEAAGFPVEIDVKWETLAEDGMSHLYESAWSKVYFEPVVEALKRVCIDDMGKEAVKGALKKIVILNEKGIYYGDRWSSFESGTLTLDHQPTSNIDDIRDRIEGLVNTLESGL